MSDSRKILVVDDNRALAENLVEILEDEGIAAEIADDGQAAMDMVAAEGYELVITDIRMPGMNGVDLLKQIHERRPELPVVVMTAYSSDAVLQEAAGAGALCVLAKPVDIGEVVGLIQRVAEPHTNVLLVEDDRDLRANLAEALLDIAQVVPVTAPDLATARRLVDSMPIRVVIVDVRLPDGDGIAFGKELRERRGDDVTLIVITGHASSYAGELQELLKSQRMHLLTKPFSPQALLDLIRNAA